MPGRKIFFVTGNEFQRSAAVFLENLIYHKKQKQEMPLFIEMNQSLIFSSKRRERLKDKTVLHFDYYPDLGMTRIPLEKLKKESRNAKKDALFSEERAFSSVFMYSELNQEALAVLPHVDYIVFIMKNDSYSSGFLYNALKFLRENNIKVKTGLVISGTRFIEDAAGFYLKLKNEAANLLREQPNCDFLGFYFLDIPRFTQARKYSQTLMKAFPESGFPGMVKYIDDQLNGLITLIHEDPLFFSLCKE